MQTLSLSLNLLRMYVFCICNRDSGCWRRLGAALKQIPMQCGGGRPNNGEMHLSRPFTSANKRENENRRSATDWYRELMHQRRWSEEKNALFSLLSPSLTLWNAKPQRCTESIRAALECYFKMQRWEVRTCNGSKRIKHPYKNTSDGWKFLFLPRMWGFLRVFVFYHVE
jgi:hypothetical protein